MLSSIMVETCTPPSASTNAPASKTQDEPSLIAVTVRPAPELPFPVVMTALRLTLEAKRMIWDLPVHGMVFGWLIPMIWDLPVNGLIA